MVVAPVRTITSRCEAWLVRGGQRETEHIMAALSVKGIGRRFRVLRGRFSVMEDLLSVSSGGVTSLRSGLLSMSTLPPVKTSRIDCGTKIDAVYSQIWTHITVRIRLVPQNLPALPTPLELWQEYWKMGI